MIIFQCHHENPERRIDTAIFKSFVSGVPARGTVSDGIVRDHPGNGISDDNRFSEMRHQFHVWKNFPDQHSSVGFEHYRRCFLLAPFLDERRRSEFPGIVRMVQQDATFGTHHFLVNSGVFEDNLRYRESFSNGEEEELTCFIESFDIVTVRPEYTDIAERSVGPWRYIKQAADQTHFMRCGGSGVMEAPNQCYWLNMYIMKEHVFSEYLEFAFSAIDAYRGLIDDALGRVPRLFGHVTERLFSIYMQTKRARDPRIKVLELPTIWRKTELDPGRATISHDFRFELGQAELRGRTLAENKT